jgi:peptidoglycan/LPS O-acetylase OafA/YrhL
MTSDTKSKRVAWLDILRVLCAIEIVGFHWLRALVKLSVLAVGQPDNFVTQYRQLSCGVYGLQNLFISHAPGLLTRVIDDSTGILFEFGWEAVHVFVLLSGFSLALTLAKRSSSPAWGSWIWKRIERILIPFYVISLPLVTAMLIFSRQSGSGLTSQLAQKLLQNGGGDISGTLLGQLLLIDPRRHLFVPVFLSPAWWFVPAIIVGYLIFPAIWLSLKKWGAGIVLPVALAISLLTYTLALNHWMTEWGWYFVAFNEAFNFCLGAALGRYYASPRAAARIEGLLQSRKMLLAGLVLVILGNLCNLYLVTYPISSSIFTIGLTICAGHLAMFLGRSRIGKSLSAIDPYVLYLLHQPFAFPLAVVMLRLRFPEIPTLGVLIYLALVLPIAWAATKFIHLVVSLIHSGTQNRPLLVAKSES